MKLPPDWPKFGIIIFTYFCVGVLIYMSGSKVEQYTFLCFDTIVMLNPMHCVVTVLRRICLEPKIQRLLLCQGCTIDFCADADFGGNDPPPATSGGSY